MSEEMYKFTQANVTIRDRDLYNGLEDIEPMFLDALYLLRGRS